MTIATLGIEVHSSNAVRGAADLDKLTASAAKAEAEALKLATASTRLATIQSQGAAAASGVAAAEARLETVRQRMASATGAAANQNDRFAQSLNRTRFETANVAAQLNDIGVQLASGTSPFLVAIQQGTQLNQILGQAGARGAIGSVAAAFTSLLNPVSLATIAIIGLGGAAVQAFMDWYSSGEKTAEQLKEQEAALRRVADRWGELAPAVQRYVDSLDAAKDKQDDLAALEQLNTAAWAEATAQVDELVISFASFIGDLQMMAGQEAAISELQGAFGRLAIAIDEQRANASDATAVTDILNKTTLAGTPVAEEFADRLTKIAVALGNVRSGAGAAALEINKLLDRVKDDNAFPATIALPGTAPVPGVRTDPYFWDAERQTVRQGYADDGTPIPGFRGVDDVPAAIDPFSIRYPKAPGSPYAQMQQELSSGINSFLQGIMNAVASGGEDVGKVLLKAILGGLADVFSQAASTLLKQFADNLAASLIGGGDSGPLEMAGKALSAANQNVPSGLGSVASAVSDVVSKSAGGMASAYRDAIALIESDGSGGYSALGPINAKMGQALGRYQMMEANLGPWGQQTFGRNIGRAEFMANPDIQDAMFDKIFGGYVDKYGERGAAQAWFGGPGSVGKLGRTDVLGTSVGGYGDKFMSALDKMQTSSTQAASAVGSLASSSNAATQGLGALGSALGSAGGGAGGGGGGGIFGWLSGLFGGGGFSPAIMSGGVTGGGVGLWAKGGVFDHGNVIPFAKGGVVSSPTTFPIGLMGEAGPEAIMPLRRGKDGGLGVQWFNGGTNDNQRNGNAKVDININLSGANGNAEVSRLAREATVQGMLEYDQMQRRGGARDRDYNYQRFRGNAK